MSGRDDDRFRIRPSAPKAKQQRFISRVLKEASKASGRVLNRSHARPGAKLGRGQVAARFAGRQLGSRSRRVVIKTRLVVLKKAGLRSTQTHLRYIERDGVGRNGEDGQAYGPSADEVDLKAFEERGREDRHQFRFIVAPEDAEQLDDLRRYTRTLMTRMEADLGTSLDWVAVDHWDTDNPHTHIVLRGKDETGHDLIIARDYISHGMRQRASELATEWLGPRTELEIRESLTREVDQQRWTGLDRAIQKDLQGGVFRLDRSVANDAARQQRMLLVGRLQVLARMGLASDEGAGIWSVRPDIEPVLRAMGERGDIVRTMQRALGEARRELAVFDPSQDVRPVIGRVAGKGLADELNDRGYLVVDGVDGRAHYIAMGAKLELNEFPVGGIVEARGVADLRAADKTIAALSVDGVYRTDHHLKLLRSQAGSHDAEEAVAAYVRRLEALRRGGVVERVADGIWRVPADLAERGRQYDLQRTGGSVIELRSHLSIERQARVIGATWLDKQLVGGPAEMANSGFGGEVRQALGQRTDFLVEQGLAEQRGQRIIYARNLLARLRDREIDTAAKAINAETGLPYRAVVDGERVTGVYRRSVLLASGRFAMLDDGMGFSLVPWKPVVEHRLGQTVSAVVHSGNASLGFGQQRAQGL